MPTPSARSTFITGAVAGAVVPAASIGSNIFSYALLLTAARLLSSSTYGELSALLGVLLVATVPQLALQTVTARRTAVDGDLRGIRSATVVAGVGTAGVLIAISPLLAVFLHLDSIVGVVVLAASVPASTTLGTLMGQAQGRRNFHRLAALTAGATIGRSLGGLIGLLLGRGTVSTLAGVGIGFTVAALIALRYSRPSDGSGSAAGTTGTAAAGGRPPARSVLSLLSEAVHAAHAHIAFLIVTSLDVLLARHLLNADDAGLYAVGSVVTRAALWAPQSVGLMLFASMSVPARHHGAVRRAIAIVLGIGLATIIGCVVAGSLVVKLVGGAKYDDLSSYVWIFAVLGVALALVQLAVLAGLARRRPRRVLILWMTGAFDVGLVLALGSNATPFRIVSVLAVIAGLAAVTGVTVSTEALASRRPVIDQLDLAAGQGLGA
ncbi:MAG: polysaccharide biosynthesis protein [Pseudonocardiales bacterium]|nr:polysaccharide biosynthesis protein [Pseudonocardiales bacterium]